MRYIIATVLLTLVIRCYGFQSSDSIQFENLISKAANNPSLAFQFLKEAEKLSKTQKQVIRLNRLIARKYFDASNYDSAQIYVDRISYVESDLSDSLINVEVAKMRVIQGGIYMASGNYDDSRKQFLDVIDMLAGGDPSRELHTAYFALGRIQKRIGKLEEAKKWIEIASEYAQEHDYPLLALKGFGEMGLIHQAQYRSKLAREYFQLGLNILDHEEIENENIYRLIRHSNIGMTFSDENELDSAFYHFNRAFELIGETRLSDFQKVKFRGTTLNNISSVYYSSGELDSAIRYARSSIDMLEQKLGEEEFYLVYPLRTLGEALSDQGYFEMAESYLLRALNISSKNQDMSGVVNALNDLASNYLNDNNLLNARIYCDSALSANTYHINGESKYYNYRHLLYSRELIASMMLRDTELRFETVEIEFEKLKSVIQYIQNEYQSQSTNNAIPAVLEYLYQAYKRLYSNSGEDRCLQRMWEIMDLNKSSKLKSQLKKEYSLTYTISEELQNRNKELKDSLSLVLATVEPNSFDSTLFFLNRKLESLNDQIEEEYPKYRELRSKADNTPYKDKQAVLSQKEVHLNFFQGEDSLYLIALYPDKAVNSSVEIDVISRRIEDFNQGLLLNKKEEMAANSKAILDLLNLDNLVSDIEYLTIVPDGVLWKLNFASLVLEEGNEVSYFGNNVTIRFHYYSNPIETKTEEKTSKEVLAFSFNDQEIEPIIENDYVSLRNLDSSIPGTSKEITAISKIWDGDYYFGPAASESTFKERSTDHSIIHLAVHGYMNEQFPENSFLKFSQEDSLNDSRLYAYELYNLNINADLAVITACNSGGGKIESGEGMMSIGRAFAYAGVESLLASRWEVPDVSAPHLMRYFYQGLQDGMRKSEALKYAQENYLTNDADNITSAPFYWAGFYILGDDSPIVSKRDNYWLLASLSVLVVFFLLLILRKSRELP